MSAHKTPVTPKGRQVDPAALAEIRALLGERPPARSPDRHLHLIQTASGISRRRTWPRFPPEMRLAMAEVYEV